MRLGHMVYANGLILVYKVEEAYIQFLRTTFYNLSLLAPNQWNKSHIDIGDVTDSRKKDIVLNSSFMEGRVRIYPIIPD